MTESQNNRIKKRIKEELSKKTFGGFCGSAEWLDQGWVGLQNMCCGELIVAIGAGQFRPVVGSVMQYVIAWHEYQAAKRELLKQYGVE